MSIKGIIYMCDICKKEETEMERINYPVKFLTEQTEVGSCVCRSVKPYISQKKLDVCNECMDKIIRLTGEGAMDYKTYKII